MEKDHKELQHESTEHHGQHHWLLVLDAVEELMNFSLLLFVFVLALTLLLFQRKRGSVFVCVVRAAHPNTDQVPLNSIEWLEVVKSPVLILVNQEAC